MGRGYEVVDGKFIFVKERIDVLLIENTGTLGLWQDKVKEKEESKPGIEWNPVAHVLAELRTRSRECMLTS